VLCAKVLDGKRHSLIHFVMEAAEFTRNIPYRTGGGTGRATGLRCGAPLDVSGGCWLRARFESGIGAPEMGRARLPMRGRSIFWRQQNFGPAWTDRLIGKGRTRKRDREDDGDGPDG
jgi:hypothetical protein